MHTSFFITPPSLKFDKMASEQAIENAINALDRQLIPNYSQVAREFGIERTTLMRRHKGICASRLEATSLHHKLLTNTQEEALISQINKLTVRGLPPTSQIVRNLAEEIIGRDVGKNWTANFVHRHSSRLKSLYLRNIDNLRMKSEYGPHIQFFFDLVVLIFSVLPVSCLLYG
jgi:transposase-like protein